MRRPGEGITMANPTRKPDPGPPSTKLAPGLQAATLEELRSAACTFDYLRSTGDPMEFWEALRLARARRGLPANDTCSFVPPTADQEASLQAELSSIRVRFNDLVGEFRDYLKDAPNLPTPADRFEMALAFMLASSREHEFIALWLREGEKHRPKAAEKLRTLASITDIYREALKPWAMNPDA